MNRHALSLLISVSLIFGVGLLMVFNTTAAEVLDRFLDRHTHYALIKQILYAVVGVIFASGVWFLGYHTILRLSGFFLGVATLFLILVFVPGIGQEINGAHRWISFFGNSFQPSEFVKFLIPLYYVHVMVSRSTPILMKDFLRLMGAFTVPLGLILVEPDNGTVAIILATLMVLFFLTRLKWIYWVLPTLILCLGGALVASRMPHVGDRIQIYLHPELDLKGKGHQPYQAKIAAGSGGLFGKGLAESLQKLDYLPEARNDYIAAIFAEEFGFVGIFFLIVGYMLAAYFGFQIAQNAPDREGFYVAALATFLICFQAFLNLGVVSGLLPSKGTNLPFFSQGGSSLLANIIGLTLILNVAKKKHVKA